MPCEGPDLREAARKVGLLHSKLDEAANDLLTHCLEALEKALLGHNGSDVESIAFTALDDLYEAVNPASLLADRMPTPIMLVELLLTADKSSTEARIRQIR